MRFLIRFIVFLFGISYCDAILYISAPAPSVKREVIVLFIAKFPLHHV